MAYYSSEPIFMQDSSVYVSRSRVVLNGVTYPTSSISSVRGFRVAKGAGGLAFGIISGIFGALFFVLGAAGGGAGFVVLGLLAGAFGAGLVAIYVWVQKDRWGIVIGSSGAERQALVTTDRPYAEAVRAAIEQAISSRSY